MVKWLMCTRAGHFSCLLFAIGHGCPLIDETLVAAFTHGHLPSVQLLVAHGLPHRPLILDLNAPDREPALPHILQYNERLLPNPGYPNGGYPSYHTPYAEPFEHEQLLYRLAVILNNGRPLKQYNALHPGQVRPDRLRCLEHLLEKGCPIHPVTLISAAERGDVDCVRLLHGAGVALWDGAYVEADIKDERRRMEAKHHLLMKRIVAVPMLPEDAEGMRRVLRYGWAMGAPLTPGMEEVFRAHRAATRTTLLCFHVAERLGRGTRSLSQETGSLTQGIGALGQGTGSLTERTGSRAQGTVSRTQGPGFLFQESGPLSQGTRSFGQGTACEPQGTGSLGQGISKQTAVWSAMGRMPIELVEQILLHAELELPETLRRQLPTERSVVSWEDIPRQVVWMRKEPVRPKALNHLCE
jgi:hypothetical protein